MTTTETPGVLLNAEPLLLELRFLDQTFAAALDLFATASDRWPDDDAIEARMGGLLDWIDARRTTLRASARTAVAGASLQKGGSGAA